MILITHYYAGALPIDEGANVPNALMMFIVSSYIFKFIFALLDTIPIYFLVGYLRKHLKIEDELGV